MIKKSILILGIIASTQASAAGCLQSPAPNAIVTSNFGMRFHPVKHVFMPHNGIDFGVGIGTKVYAAHAGTVIVSNNSPTAGLMNILLGDGGVQTKYFHLSKKRDSGHDVGQGALLALSGNTGRGTGAHLHFETLVNGRHVDPRTMLCDKPQERSGAGPDRQSPSGEIAPGGTESDMNTGAPDFASYEGMSEMDVFRSEAEKRFINPDWHAKLTTCGKDMDADVINENATVSGGVSCKRFMELEMTNMRALKNWINFKTLETKERITSLRANQMLNNVKGSNKEELNRLKQKALDEEGRRIK